MQYLITKPLIVFETFFCVLNKDVTTGVVESKVKEKNMVIVEVRYCANSCETFVLVVLLSFGFL